MARQPKADTVTAIVNMLEERMVRAEAEMHSVQAKVRAGGIALDGCVADMAIHGATCAFAEAKNAHELACRLAAGQPL